MKQNGHHRDVAVVDAIDEVNADQTNFLDADNPLLQPAKESEVIKKRSWKRRLIRWAFMLFLIGGGAVALYLLLRVNRVNVRVQADTPKENSVFKPKNDATNSESVVTAEAIDIARQATGLDTGTVRKPGEAQSTASPVPSPSIQFTKGPNLTFTANNSPATERFDDSGAKDANQQNKDGSQTPSKSTDSTVALIPQSHANPTQSLYVEDYTPRLNTSPSQNTSALMRTDKSLLPLPIAKASPAVLPPFGTMLPVRTQGVIFTLRNNSYARFELTRDCAGAGWSLPKGTVVVGRTIGGESDRAFISVIGYIDPHDNKLVKLTGEVLGADGATGIAGKRMGVDRNRLKETLRKVAGSGVQVAGSLAGALTGRGTVVIDSAGYRLMNPLTSGAQSAINGANDRNSFVKVEAGRAAYVMVADLPKNLQAVDAPGDDDVANAARSLTDREVMELILFGSSEDIRAASPLMTAEQKRLVMKSLAGVER